MTDAVEFTAPCPRGHAGARWSAALRTIVGEACDDYLGAQRPQYAVECPRCASELDPGRASEAEPRSAARTGAVPARNDKPTEPR